METSEPKWVNSIWNIIWVNSIRLGNLYIISYIKDKTNKWIWYFEFYITVSSRLTRENWISFYELRNCHIQRAFAQIPHDTMSKMMPSLDLQVFYSNQDDCTTLWYWFLFMCFAYKFNLDELLLGLFFIKFHRQFYVFKRKMT